MAANYFFLFMTFGMTLPYLSPVLLDLGYSKEQAGMILAGVFSCHAVIPMLGGRISDRYLSADRMLRYGAYGMLLMAVAISLRPYRSSWLFLVLLLGFAMARAPLVSLQDALSMQVARGNPGSFSRLRLLGSLGFAVAVTGFGYVADAFGTTAFFPVLTLCCGLFAFQCWFLPKEQKIESSSVDQGFWQSLTPSWWLWLLAMSLHWFCYGPYNYGFTLLLEEQQVPTRYTGWFWSVGIMVEIGFFMGSGWFFAKWDYRRLLFAALFANLIRWLLIALFPSPSMIALSQLLHGPGFALFYAAAIQGIDQYCGGVNRASYQGLFATTVSGLGSILGAMLAGSLHQHMPMRELILWFLPFQAGAIVLLASATLKPRVRKGGESTS